MSTISTVPYRPLEQVVRVPAVGPIMRQMYVHNTYGNDDGINNGASPEHPFKTLDAAVNRHAGNQSATEYGCVIHLMPGHAETLTEAAGVDIDQNNIHVIGHGHGEQRPKFTFTTAITADFDIAGNNVQIENVIFVNGVNNLTAPLHITGNDCTLLDVDTRDNDSSMHCDNFILADGASRLQVLNWTHRANTDGTGQITAITLRGTMDDVVIIPKWIDGLFSTAVIRNDSTAIDNLQIFGSALWPAYVRNRHATGLISTAAATTKGRYGPYLNIRSEVVDFNSILVGADMEFFNPIAIVNSDGERSADTGQTQSTT